MMKKWLLRVLPVVYMGAIWLQSQYFKPSAWEFEDFFIFRSLSVMTGSSDGESWIELGTLFELGHLVEFGILYTLLYVALSTVKTPDRKMRLTALVISVTYALLDEWHQSFVPYRSASGIDLVKDFIGITVAWGLTMNWHRIRSLIRRADA